MTAFWRWTSGTTSRGADGTAGTVWIMPIQENPSARRGNASHADAWRAIGVCGLLVLMIGIAFGRTLGQGFSNLDDPLFVSEEPHVSGGFSWSGIVWAFTNGPAGEWFPLSMLSHMLDCQLYGLNPAGHHLTNVLLHAASAALLFLVLLRMTAALWPSALVAALFALHPLRVESVAWVAERRDVLSGMFFMLALLAYDEYVRRRQSRWWYFVVAALFALGLMAKPMLMSLPPLLLLLDYWPLGRFREAGHSAPSSPLRPAQSVWWLVLEKLPLLALALADLGMTLLTHSEFHGGLTLPERLANAAVSCVAYLGQLFVPVGMSVFYSFPDGGWPAWHVGAAVALLLAITAAAVIFRRSAPYLFVGWFWYVGMLVPVLGVISQAASARADRYTYLPQIGIYLALVWGASRLCVAWPARRWVFGVGSALLLAAQMACTWRQTGFWRDSKTLWEHALACDQKNAMAHYDLGLLLEKEDEPSAEAHYRLALELGQNDPNLRYMVLAKALDRLGNIAFRKRDIEGATAYFRRALELNPNYALAHQKLGLLQLMKGNRDEAIAHFQSWVELSPDDAVAHCQLADVLALQGRTNEAAVQYHRALEIDPNLAPAARGLQQLSDR